MLRRRYTVCRSRLQMVGNQEVKNQFFMQCDALKDSLQDIANQERLLRIGIVGSVKAGKSTFLNSLLFDGQEVLPRAATPMTASLTCLFTNLAMQKWLSFFASLTLGLPKRLKAYWKAKVSLL